MKCELAEVFYKKYLINKNSCQNSVNAIQTKNRKSLFSEALSVFSLT
jgi:hypothetical protein